MKAKRQRTGKGADQAFDDAVAPLDRRGRHRGGMLWLTGLPASGKSTLALRLTEHLAGLGWQSARLDGAEMRSGLCSDLGFSSEDRAEHVRRAGEMALTLAQGGAVVVCAFISPCRQDRDAIRARAGALFHEVHVQADLVTCESRDPKGLYAKARAGEIADFTGISAPYEAPTAAELVIDSARLGVEDCTRMLLAYARRVFAQGAPPAKTLAGLSTVSAAEAIPKPVLHPSPGLGGWLREMGGSLAFSTYQSSRLFFLFPGEGGSTVGQERIVGSAMGLAIDPNALWISNKEQVWRFSNVGPRKIKDEDWQAVYMPRKGYFLGGCDTHDIVPGATFKGRGYELAFVNTAYSCIAAVDAHYGFRPIWKPDFITALSPEDRCHLNGMGARDGELAFATLCGRFDTPIGWKEVKNGGGCVVDLQTDQILCQGLSMPHSPRWHNDRLWLLNSGDGDFGYLDGERFIPVTQCPGFARGLCFVGDYAVIGLSRLRDNTFASGMNIKDRLDKQNILQRCGLIVVDLRSGKTVHWLTIDGISELYDVGFLPGITRPYTPGFSEPDLHRRIMHGMPGVFPFAPPRPRPDAETTGGDGKEIQQ